MRKAFSLLLALMLLSMAFGAASASVSATPNQELAFRTGPNTAYVWVGHMPQSTRIRAFEYEMGNDVTWVLVEYEDGGRVYRAYTGLKRMSVSGSIPWASHLDRTVRMLEWSSVLAAPSSRGGYRGAVNQGESVTLLDYEGGYAFIEFYDASNGAKSRGYVDAWRIDDSGSGYDVRVGVRAEPNQKLGFRSGPNTRFTEIGTFPQSTQIVAYEYEMGNDVAWVLCEFRQDGWRVRGYTGLKRMTVQGTIPWADHLYETIYVPYGCEILAAPGTDGLYRGRLNGGAGVTLLEYDGDYAFIEYNDRDTGRAARGYIEASVVSDAYNWEYGTEEEDWAWGE